MYIESNDPEGAKVYDMIIRQIFQDLVLPPSIDDMRAYVNPNEVCFIIAIKMRKTSQHITLKEVAKVNYEADDDTTVVLIDDENYLPKRRKMSKRSISDYQPKSGTAVAYEYAVSKNKKIINICSNK